MLKSTISDAAGVKPGLNLPLIQTDIIVKATKKTIANKALTKFLVSKHGMGIFYLPWPPRQLYQKPICGFWGILGAIKLLTCNHRTC